MGLSSVLSPAPPAQAAPPTAYTQVAATDTKNLEDVANLLQNYRGPRRTHWLSESTWTREYIEDDPMSAWVEVMAAVDTFWTTTLPNNRAGCQVNPETQMCHILKQIEKDLEAELGPVMTQVEAEQDKGSSKVSRKLAKKMGDLINKWVPDTKSGTDFTETKGWSDKAGDFVPGDAPVPTTSPFVPTDDDL
tara:strand:- start:55 stop:627 length:573 start_codon:yes stop_codon:yes gene_type:complete